MNHQIDAKEQSLGRVASKAAVILMGKNSTAYVANKPGEDGVTIINAAQLKIGEKKRVQKMYDRYSGYPGGRSEKSLEKTIVARGYGEILRRAIKGMLPHNRLAAIRMKKLRITE